MARRTQRILLFTVAAFVVLAGILINLSFYTSMLQWFVAPRFSLENEEDVETVTPDYKKINKRIGVRVDSTLLHIPAFLVESMNADESRCLLSPYFHSERTAGYFVYDSADYDCIEKLSDATTVPPVVGYVALALDYRAHIYRGDSLCSGLGENTVSNICTAQQDLGRALPRRFSLTSKNNIAHLPESSLSGQDGKLTSTRQLANAFEYPEGQPEAQCAGQSRLCYANVQIADNLYAYWVSSRHSVTSLAPERLNEQACRIVTLVQSSFLK